MKVLSPGVTVNPKDLELRNDPAEESHMSLNPYVPRTPAAEVIWGIAVPNPIPLAWVHFRVWDAIK